MIGDSINSYLNTGVSLIFLAIGIYGFYLVIKWIIQKINSLFYSSIEEIIREIKEGFIAFIFISIFAAFCTGIIVGMGYIGQKIWSLLGG